MRCLISVAIIGSFIVGFFIVGSPRLEAQAPAAEPTSASQPSDQSIRVAKLVRDLGSSHYGTRQDADHALAAMGSSARASLEEAAKSDDPEVRLRANELLRRIKIEELMAPGRATLTNIKGPAGKIVAQIAEQTGNHVMLGDQYGGFHDQELTLDQTSGTFWPLIDEICRKSGHRIRTHYDSRQPGLVVIDGGPTSFPTAYVGPVRAQIVNAKRDFTEELDYENVSSTRTHNFQFNFALMWEDRFRVVAYRSQPELVAATTNQGVELAATQPAAGGWNVAGSGTHQVSMNLRLHPPATSAKQLDTFRLRWAVLAVGDFASLDATDLTTNKVYMPDDVELQIETAPVINGTRCELCVLVHREQMITEPRDATFQELEFELYDNEGRQYRRQGQTNSFTDDGARSKISFQAESADSQPQRLRLNYPRLRTERNLDIVFRNVPLPTGRPE